jgi:hypothetical protein
MGASDDIKGKAEELGAKATELGGAAGAKATELGGAAGAKATELGGAAGAKATELGGAAGAKATEIAEQVKSVIGDLVDKHGDQATDAVQKATAFVDEKSGGKSAAVSEKVNAAAQTAVSSLKPEATDDSA